MLKHQINGICSTDYIFIVLDENITFIENSDRKKILKKKGSSCLRINRIQSSAVITRSNIVRYCINDYRKWGRMSIRCWIHQCLLWILARKFYRVITKPHCMQYIPKNKHVFGMLCIVIVVVSIPCYWFTYIIRGCFCMTSGQSFDCTGADEVALYE